MKILEKLLNVILAATVVTIAVVTIMQVFSRFVLKLPIPWATDVVRISFIFCIFFGATIAVREKSHLSVDFLTSILSNKAQVFLEYFSDIFILFFLVFMVRYGFVLAMKSMNQSMPYLTWIKMAYVYMSIPISGTLMIFYTLLNVRRKILGKDKK